MNVFINDWHLIADENHLSRDGMVIDIQPLCLRLLTHLAKNPGEIITREELIERVWFGRIVSEDAINNCVRKLRRHLHDDSKNPQIIQTVNGMGYRLIADVKAADAHTRPIIRNSFRFGMAMSLLVGILSLSPIDFKVYKMHEGISDAEREELYKSIVLNKDKRANIVTVKLPVSHKQEVSS